MLQNYELEIDMSDKIEKVLARIRGFINSDIYKIVEVNPSKLMKDKKSIKSLLDREIEGLIIKSFISQQERVTVIEQLDNLNDELKIFSILYNY